MHRSTRRALALLAAVVTSMMMAAPAFAGDPTAAATTKVVSYAGYRFTVPASWPVVRLDQNPTACVRYDRHAVYLGTPGDQDCPAHLVGRTEALLVQPAAGGKRPTRTVDHAVGHELAADAPGITATATYGADRALARGILISAGLPAPSTASTAATTSAALDASVTDFVGLGFDACTAPSSTTMNAWKASSPYGAIGVYIGGSNRACAQPNLTASWVSQQAAAGWRFLLLYVGPQASTSSCSGCTVITSPTSEGTSAADDAIAQAASVGFPPGVMICYDMESYPSTQSSIALAFESAWTTELHARGYKSGIYSSLSTGITDLVNNYTTSVMPDVIDFGNWNGNTGTSDPAIPSDEWANHQRIHQYRGGHTETYGGYTINIDQDSFDVQLDTSAPTTVLAGGPVVYNEANGNLEIYYNSSGALKETYHSSSGWVGPVSMGVSVSGRPAAIYDPVNGNLEVYYNSGGALMQKYFSVSTGWGGPLNLGGSISGSPVPIYDPATGNIEVYYNSGGVLAENYYSGGWSGQVILGGSISGTPSVVYNPAYGNLEVYFNSNGVLAENYHSSTGWSGAFGLGGSVSGSPAAIYDPANGNLEVYFNSGGVLKESYHTAVGWSGPVTVGGSISGNPAPVYDPAYGNLEVYFNSGGLLAENYHSTTGWSGAFTLPGSLTGTPVALYDPAYGNLEVYYNSGGLLKETYHSSSGWVGPVSVGGTVTGSLG